MQKNIIRYSTFILLILFFIVSCASTNPEGTEADGLHLESVIPDPENPLLKERTQYLDSKEVFLRKLILIVKYDDNNPTKIQSNSSQGIKNEDAKYLEKTLYKMIRRISDDMARETGLLIALDALYDDGAEVLFFDTKANSHKTLQWSVLEGDAGNPFDYLVSTWEVESDALLTHTKGDQSIRELDTRRQNIRFTISFIDEKYFRGYKVNISANLKTLISGGLREYRTAFIYREAK